MKQQKGVYQAVNYIISGQYSDYCGLLFRSVYHTTFVCYLTTSAQSNFKKEKVIIIHMN